MKEEHKRANEQFFTRVIQTLGEGGVYGWVSLNEIMIKKGNKLVCTKRAYEEVQHIVSEQYLKSNFELNG